MNAARALLESSTAGASTDRRQDKYAILTAKTDYREAYNTADLERLLGVFASEFTDCSDGEPSFYGEEAVHAIRLRTEGLFRRFRIEMTVIVVEVTVSADSAYDWGWHNVFLIDKLSGHTTFTKYRYFELWKRAHGAWKICHIITNQEHPPRLLPFDSKDARTPQNTTLSSSAELLRQD